MTNGATELQRAVALVERTKKPADVPVPISVQSHYQCVAAPLLANMEAAISLIRAGFTPCDAHWSAIENLIDNFRKSVERS